MFDSVITREEREQSKFHAGIAARGISLLCLVLIGVFAAGCATAPKWSEMPVPAPGASATGTETTAETPAVDAAPAAEAPTAAAAAETPAAAADAPAVAPASASAPPQMEVVLQPYDAIRVKFLYWPELDDEQMIRPDGKISLLMVGEVEAQNRTPEELQKELVKLYESKLNEPEINVVVTSLANNRVYIGGEVATPGLILIQGQLTVLGAIMQAGGFIESSAKKSSVVIVRQQGGKQYARTLDLRKALTGAESEPFFLQPCDIVYVPRTTITHVDEFVAQYIDGVIPKHLSFSVGLYNQSLSGSSVKVPTNITLPSLSSGSK